MRTKRTIINKSMILISCLVFGIVLFIFLFTVSLASNNVITIAGQSSTFITIPKNTDSIDGEVLISIASDSKSGEIKLISGEDWYDSENDLHFNIKKAQVEKWSFDDSGELIKNVVNNEGEIQVDSEGIIIKAPFSKTFTDVIMKDLTLEVRNISKHSVTIKVEWIYK